ncbi:hypothetical protein TSUD_365700 [Trifolium subterraneum]|uniref:Acetyltransferase n=1 Tax=Trifolium subterraneum TaxID=3900 RepID=A0A2Z6P3K1_TRISU|nr:hypothetical protein TSUD_365700 [Trifolium subterraneum]
MIPPLEEDYLGNAALIGVMAMKAGELLECQQSDNSLAISSSPRFDVYGNDFGWGKPVAVRNGSANKNNGKIAVFAGAEQGSIDIEVCLSYEV